MALAYHHASATNRGFDDNVSEATVEETHAFTTAVSTYLEGISDETYRETMAGVVALILSFLFKKSVSVQARRLLIIFCADHSSILGNVRSCTHGYVAWGVKERELVFFKDAWRVDAKNVLPEPEAYKILKKLGVPHLPVVYKAEDVTYKKGGLQMTRQDEFLMFGYERNRIPSVQRLSHFVHFRIVQKLAMPLHLVRSSRQLVQAVRNVLVDGFVKLFVIISRLIYCIMQLSRKRTGKAGFFIVTSAQGT